MRTKRTKVPQGTFKETCRPARFPSRFVPRQGLWVPAVFGPYKGYSTLPGDRGQFKREERERHDDGEASHEFKELKEVLHTALVYTS